MKDELIIQEFKDRYPEIENWLVDAKVNGIDFEEYLYSRDLIPAEEILELKGKVYNLPIKRFELDETIPIEVLSKIQESTARNYKILPFDFRNNVLYLGVVNPDLANLQSQVIDMLKISLKVDIKLFLISIKDFYIHLDDYHEFDKELKKLILEFRNLAGKRIEEEKTLAFQQQVVSAEEGPIIKLFELVLRRAVALKASDIHLEPFPDKARIRLRLLGDLKTFIYLPKDVHFPLVNRVKILTNLKLDETRITQDGRFRAFIQGREIDFRVGIFPTINGEKVAIRILDPLVGLKKVSDLGLAEYHQNIIRRNLRKSYGMILVTGPTGSGKTTTLYALVQEINKETINIVSLEDPVEYKVLGINQSQVRPEIGYTFATGLREILRQDPDVILVGEVRDEETAELVTHAALTGHIVFSTLHTNTAVGAIPRLINMGVKSYFIPSTIILVIAQRLVRKLCPHCLTEKSISDDIFQEAKEALELAPSDYKNIEIKSFQSKGCEKCNFRGFVGRVGIFEMFEMTKEVEEIISDKIEEREILEVLKKQNFISMRVDGIIKASQGLVSLEEVFKSA
ncbi:MAG: GspE/PulE family protein [Patescibacteria group bacterium]|nr:GspE/PulE family protein [Patescibacteria group bacterium]